MAAIISLVQGRQPSSLCLHEEGFGPGVPAVQRETALAPAPQLGPEGQGSPKVCGAMSRHGICWLIYAGSECESCFCRLAGAFSWLLPPVGVKESWVAGSRECL